MVPALPTRLATIYLLSFFALVSSAANRDILRPGTSLTVEAYQSEILQSPDGTFSCGFYGVYDNAFTFSIWYSKAANRTVVWSANRHRPVHSRRNIQHAQLLDTGNLVMKNTSGATIWQSFDSPTDTLLPAQYITATTKLVSTTQSHAPGNYIFRFNDISLLSLIYDVPEVSDIYWPNPDNSVYDNNRSRYNSTRLAILDNNGVLASSDFADGVLLKASDAASGTKRRLTLDPDGNLRLYSLNDSDGMWSVSMVAISQPCTIHGLCGQNGICHYSPEPTCSCPPGYVMTNPGNWTQGCTASFNIPCHDQEPMKFVKLPHTDFWGSDQKRLLGVSFEACRNSCINDCTCKGFQYQQGTGSCYPKALLFNGKSCATRSVRTIYLKIPARLNVSDTPIPQSNVLDPAPPRLDCNQMSRGIRYPFPDLHKTGDEELNWLYFYSFIVAIFVFEVSFITFAWFFVLRRELRPSEMWAAEEGYRVMTSHFRRYSYRELVEATRKFRVELGRGSSGTVYKGVLEDERPVAVKKLENVSRGKEEFQAELSVIGRIYHMNLARIWGVCSEGSHRLLVCEYVENGSLANILFNDQKAIVLDWKQRFNIALGIAKGLAYLHHECLEWVIHCDVKPENILLDTNFEPKITDFGLTKLLNRGGATQNMSQVRGTIGYIAPEWVSSLPITAKVDVYSYGVVLLELLSGTRVSELAVGSGSEVHSKLQKLVRVLADKLGGLEESSINEFVDPELGGQFSYVQARTMIKLAVSCLQEDRNKRPTMESVVQTLLPFDEASG
ncbi:putative receptor protein kinase ZmPK1 isoform X2 [Hordeum vulgare subsp. vulgare]|uniref:putative receptor protein kinase ZmPK1 isoform X2 n=1 Tax=Hordeum vulgare subsp. vulgare TaxID=112509 RepID=UPI001D1A4060|nr:putative receptor protein kinase ZmPK1 isoform X2 [Hordeum vulgare subsp. vulgare]